MRNVSTCLWYDGTAQEAAEHYVAIFGDRARITDIQYYTEAGPGEPGSVVTVEFEIAGQRFTGLNGGPHFTFDEAISIAVECEDQAEVDRYWEALLADGGQESQCGWLKDKYGLSWQIVPVRLLELAADPDPAVGARVTRAMLGMRKLEVQALEAAAAG